MCSCTIYDAHLRAFSSTRGVSLYVVQGFLGHSLVRTTQRYAHLTSDTLADAAEVIRAVILPCADASAAFSQCRRRSKKEPRQTSCQGSRFHTSIKRSGQEVAVSANGDRPVARSVFLTDRTAERHRRSYSRGIDQAA